MTRNRRILIAAVIAVPLLLPLLLAAVVLMLPAERIGTFAAARAESALGRDVEVERFRIRLLPRPAIALENVAVAGVEHGAGPLATIARAELRPRLLPLLQRRVLIDELVLEGAAVLVEQWEDGTTNLPEFAAGDDVPAGGPDAELSIRRLRVRNGHIAWRDYGTGSSIDLAGIEQRLRVAGSIAQGELARIALEGTLDIAGVNAELPGTLAFPLRDVRLRVEHDLHLDRGADRLEIGRLVLGVQELDLDVAGRVDALSDATRRTLDLRASTGTIDVARLIASLPRAFLERGGETLTGAAGRASLDATVVGRAGDGASPAIAGELRLEDAALARGRAGIIADGVAGRVAFSNDSIASDGISGRLLGEALHASFVVREFGAPHGRLALRTALALGEAQRLGLMGEDARGTGKVSVDVVIEGAALEPEAALLTGRIGLSGVQVTLAALRQPVLVESGTIELRGRDAASNDMRASIGRSDAALEFHAAGYLPYMLGDSARPPVITFDARSTLFDADEILGAEPERFTYSELFFARLGDRTLDGLTAAQAAEEIGLGLPEMPPVVLDGRVRATRFVRGATAFDDVDVSVGARNRELEVRAASFNMMGGGVHLRGRLGLAAGPSPEARAQPLVLDYTVSNVTADAFLERFTALQGRISGAMLLDGSVRMNLDEHLLPVTETVTGDGSVAIVDGRIERMPLLRELGTRIGLGALDTLSFRDWTGRYSIAGSRIALEETMLEAGTIAVRAAGGFDVSGVLDLGATVYVPQQYAARIPGAPAAFLVSAVSGADGRVPIGARITGTAAGPDIRLDLSEAGALAANRAREAAQNEARELAERVVEDLAERLPPGVPGALPSRDSVAIAADSARSRVQQELQDRLRRIIRPGGG